MNVDDSRDGGRAEAQVIGDDAGLKLEVGESRRRVDGTSVIRRMSVILGCLWKAYFEFCFSVRTRETYLGCVINEQSSAPKCSEKRKKISAVHQSSRRVAELGFGVLGTTSGFVRNEGENRVP